MYRRILVPLDGSSISQRGLQHAFELAKGGNARLRLLNVIENAAMMPALDAYPLVSDMTFMVESLRAARKKMLADAMALAEEHGVKAEQALRRSSSRYVSDVILDDARTWRADLIVMGTHGRRGLNRLLLGSDAERVLRDSPVPVLLTRQKASRAHTRSKVGLRKSR